VTAASSTLGRRGGCGLSSAVRGIAPASASASLWCSHRTEPRERRHIPRSGVTRSARPRQPGRCCPRPGARKPPPPCPDSCSPAGARWLDLALYDVFAEGESYYCDIELRPPSGATASYAPLVRLAVARYQPDSLTGLELSAPTLTDWAQLLPDRHVAVDRAADALPGGCHGQVVVSVPSVAAEPDQRLTRRPSGLGRDLAASAGHTQRVFGCHASIQAPAGQRKQQPFSTGRLFGATGNLAPAHLTDTPRAAEARPCER